jgi:sensor histidine kinase regulating citrate/malate metabolism
MAVTIAAILIEILISGTFSRRIKQKLLGYEPDTFSSMFTIRDNILESIHDGIIAVDDEKNVQFTNSVAKKILDCEENEKINQINEKVFVEKFLSNTLNTAQSTFGIQEKTNSGTELLVDCIPVMKGSEVNGAVAILHDRTEYTKLMEDLSGTKYLVDSMRANNHDFTNKLHVILGLIQIGEYDKAVSYIENISIIQRETLSKVMHSVDNPSFAALLIGKIARASECNVKFILK